MTEKFRNRLASAIRLCQGPKWCHHPPPLGSPLSQMVSWWGSTWWQDGSPQFKSREKNAILSPSMPSKNASVSHHLLLGHLTILEPSTQSRAMTVLIGQAWVIGSLLQPGETKSTKYLHQERKISGSAEEKKADENRLAGRVGKPGLL